MRKTYKFRIYPKKATERKLYWTLTRCRELYNAALSERKDAYQYAAKSVSYYDQQNDLPEIKHEIRPEYQDIAAHMLQDVLQTSQPATSLLGPVLLAELMRRTDDLSAIQLTPLSMRVIPCEPLIGYVDAQRFGKMTIHMSGSRLNKTFVAYQLIKHMEFDYAIT